MRQPRQQAVFVQEHPSIMVVNMILIDNLNAVGHSKRGFSILVHQCYKYIIEVHVQKIAISYITFNNIG